MFKESIQYLLFVVFFFAISCMENEQKPFSFVQLCDTQLGMGGYEHDIRTFKQAVRQINMLDADFVVICGDLVNHANDSSYSDFNLVNSISDKECSSFNSAKCVSIFI